MTEENNELMKANPKLVEMMSTKYGISPEKFIDTLKGTIMKPDKNGKVATNEEIAAFLIVANKYNLNPFTGEIFAFPDKRAGVIPVVGVDGFTTIANRDDQFDGYEIIFAETIIKHEKGEHKPCPEWAEIKIYRKDRTHPTIVREYFDEVYMSPAKKGGYSGPWQSHTKRMLRHKIIAQGVRVAFGISGIYDEDEAYRIVQQVSQQIEQTGKPPVSLPDKKNKKEIETTAEPVETDPTSEEDSEQTAKLKKLAEDCGVEWQEVMNKIGGDYGIEFPNALDKKSYASISGWLVEQKERASAKA